MDELLAFILLAVALFIGVFIWGAFVLAAILMAASTALYYGLMALSWLSGKIYRLFKRRC